MEKLGITLTSLWCLLISSLIYLKWDLAQGMSLNEWGDFLAGVTAPLAFLWLIIGYMLQREELKLNTEALLHQRDELLKQAEETVSYTQFIRDQASAAKTQERELRRQKRKERFKERREEKNN